MTDGSWSEWIAAERMQTDQEFAERIAASPLSSQQWGLVMTAVEFEIDSPEDPDVAELRGDTSRLPSVMDEIHRMAERSAGGMGSPQRSETSATRDGLIGTIKRVLGFDGRDDRLKETAEELVAEYTEKLQARLEQRDRWEAVCEQARS